ncbi:Uncharacterised protein [Campylobacter sputorum subsp. bubulus]|uniref:Uncharacterized protein n=1 Tax=Campylobacter sputorum subsp. sputorum TaxID=32024 RepID=A0A381DKM2_9BACT|nr:hypothetical protein [Campylobacter sputorum]ASM34514.1 hypothetical protein CSPUT_0253 [Campylobacter sputorum aubsp. sputorum RM3237]KAB0580620.1 hypothetical protein F7P64_08790 [Campylobacter sputorum subsp. sputorum]QEL04704.1 putative membrane protein [Campylobacter sputorum subsp. sputorum]SUX09586.1 Uncharacterised protein [Campylobacter sputorum subsp. bubulus]SUX11185.1 Uncharacterised protein [Campylobacter sputorum subsp. sputorum]
MDNTEQKPIFVMKRKKSFMITLYYIFVILWDLATAFVCIAFMTLDNIVANIIGFVLLIFLPYKFFCMFDIKEVICYEDYFIIKRKFFTKKIFYNRLKYYCSLPTITAKTLGFRFKKYRFTVTINKYMFKKDDINKFIEFLESKNITKYKMFKL